MLLGIEFFHSFYFLQIFFIRKEFTIISIRHSDIYIWNNVKVEMTDGFSDFLIEEAISDEHCCSLVLLLEFLVSCFGEFSELFEFSFFEFFEENDMFFGNDEDMVRTVVGSSIGNDEKVFCFFKDFLFGDVAERAVFVLGEGLEVVFVVHREKG
jgi:hypothetical protein